MSNHPPPPASSAAAPPPSAAAAARICFNVLCRDSRSEAQRRRGWRLRSGEHAELCDRCGGSYEQGTFCEAYHSEDSGWRNCEACGKRVHCGCIVSAPTYMLLDAGGVECVACARKGLLLAPKQVWSSQLLRHLPMSERPKDFHVKGRNQMAGPVLGQWRQASNMWNVASAQSELHQRLAFEFDRPNSIEKMFSAARSSNSALDKKADNLPDRAPSNINHVAQEIYPNGTTGLNSSSTFNIYTGEGKAGSVQNSGHHGGETDFTRKGMIPDPCSTSSRINYETHPNSRADSVSPSVLKEDSTSGLIGLAALSSPNDINDPDRISAGQTHQQTTSSLAKSMYTNSNDMTDPCGELQAHMHNGRPRQDPRARAQLLPRYWPRATDKELQQISGDSNSVITPLFEKMLSASDAGRIGRLVLPKKCAEAYFPPISHPEGLPLKVQDVTGKEWMFQFRFWPNNNSRMYVLEGVTPCIQSMQLQAGDTVTFSRIAPEGKLVMGFRKASSTSTEQDNQTPKTGNGSATPPEATNINISAGSTPNLARPLKGSMELRNPTNTSDLGTGTKPDESGFIKKNGLGAKTPASSKRKGKLVGLKGKRLRTDPDDAIQLKLTFESAQGLLRPPPNCIPSVVTIDGHEFEEYEEAPVIGMPTFFSSSPAGDTCQWALCEDCSKWRKLPADALLPAKWTCSDNTWDPKRSSCSSAQEQLPEDLLELLPVKNGAKKRSRVKVENDSVEVSDGLDTLANLAILGENEVPTSSQPPTTKHPRHRPGCSCIVCIQPPSGKGPKHKQTCTCNVCLTVKRRFKTLMLRREKRQSEKDAENARKQQLDMSQMATAALPTGVSSPSGMANKDGVVDEESGQKKTLPSPLKTQIDLNIQPEREEEPSPLANAGSMHRAFSRATT